MTAAAIPVQNLYYLLCYAWNRLPEAEVVNVSALPSMELADLFARVLSRGVRHLIRRGLEQGYREEARELAGIRGRVDIVGSARRLLLAHGRAHCVLDELIFDTRPNQIIKATLAFLANVPTLDRNLRREVLLLHGKLAAVTAITLTSQAFRTVQLNGNSRFYRFLLNVCDFIRRSWLVDEKTGEYKFRDFFREDREMARVFEDFVFNFFRLERRDLLVKEERILWKAVSQTDPTLSLLPQMRTDISIEWQNIKLIVDTKFYSKTFSSYFDTTSLHSQHLYQMFAYLMNTDRGDKERLEGMVLYPQVQARVRQEYIIQGMTIRVCTVDLAGEWQGIHHELLELLKVVENRP